MKNYKKYKEVCPEKTINSIRSILAKLNILTLDSIAENDNIFACRIILGNQGLDKLQIGTNGKGPTFEYALASGYAEFIEYVQNRFLLKQSRTIYGTKAFLQTLPDNSKFKNKVYEDNSALDFIYDEREEFWNIDQVLNTFGNELILLYNVNDIEELKSLLVDIMRVNKDHILMVPCYSQKDNKEIFIPYDLVLSAQGSNGMSSGNSELEALIHGFCEVFERYALQQIYYNKLTPPSIPIEDFVDTPIYEKIKYLQEKRGYEIIIKDCSLGKGLPVYGVITIDKKKHLYNFNLGASFVPYVAVDRCLNEAYQSKNGFIGLPINFNGIDTRNHNVNNTVKVDSNYYKVLESGTGVWPLSILFSTESYQYLGENPNYGISNEKDINHCIEIVKKLGFNIYIRNNSMTGFPTYYTIIPGMSQALHSKGEYEKKYGKGTLNYLTSFPQLNDMTQDKVKEFAQIMEIWYDEGYPFMLSRDYLLCNTNEDFLGLNMDIFLCMIYYYAEDFFKSKEYIDKYIQNQSEKNKHLYFYAVSDYINFTHIEKIPKEEVKVIMEKIYGNKLATEVISDMLSTINIFQYYNFPNCLKCENCKVEETCQFFNILKIESILNKFSVINGISYKQVLNLNNL